MQFDVAIVGGGIVGLATAYQMQKQNPKLNLILLKKKMNWPFISLEETLVLFIQDYIIKQVA